MISYLNGKLAYKLETSVVIDTGGVGYEVFVPTGSGLFLSREGEEVSVFTVMIVKEDEMSLYGFSDRESVRLFRLLLGVSGVGAKAAMAILSAMSASEAINAISFGDAAMLTRANGVGKKSAERIILELSDKLSALPPELAASARGSASTGGAQSKPDPRAEAIEVLLTLGLARSEAGAAVMGVKEENLTPEAYVKQALRNLA
jgi:Holliday junction DNA helicase RuvA